MTERWLWTPIVFALACGSVRHIPAPDVARRPSDSPPPKAHAHYIRGRLALLQGQLDEAAESLALARVFDPSSAHIPIAQGEIHLVAGDIQAARGAWAEATQLDPDSSLAWIQLARADRLVGDLDEAKAHYAAAVRAGHGWQARAGLFDVLERSADASAARDVLRAWVELEEVNPVALGERGQRRLRMGDAAGAARDMAILARQHSRNMSVVVRWVEAVRESGVVGPTLVELKSMLVQDPTAEPILWALAVLGSDCDDLATQEQALEDWIGLEPEDTAQLQIELAGVRFLRGHSSDALTRLDGLSPEDRKRPQARWWAARALLELGHPAQAMARLADAPESASGAEAWRALRSSIELALGHRQAAKERVTQGREPLVGLQAWVGVLRDAGQVTEAQAVVADARHEHPGNMVLDQLAAELALVADQPDKVVELTRPWLQVESAASLPLRYVHAIAVGQIQGVTSAVEMMRKIHEERPEHVGAMLHLARWTSDTDRAGAAELAQQVVDREPVNPEALALLGWLYHQMGRDSEAVGLLLRAATLAPEDSAIADRLHLVRERNSEP